MGTHITSAAKDHGGADVGDNKCAEEEATAQLLWVFGVNPPLTALGAETTVWVLKIESERWSLSGQWKWKQRGHSESLQVNRTSGRGTWKAPRCPRSVCWVAGPS